MDDVPSLIDWPVGLKGCIEQAKKRERAAAYKEISLTAGTPVVELTTDETPVFFDLKFIFTSGQARAFQAWLKLHDIRSKSPSFNFPIQTEIGLTTQEVRFVTGGYPQASSQSLRNFTYQARVVVLNYTTAGII